MLDAESIFRLYANVMHNDIVENAVPVSEIRAGIQCMANVYMKESDFNSIVLKFPNYNDIACRCAYLHKYAPLHTFIVTDVMLKVLQDEFCLFRNLLENSNCFNICSLGGGPGSDVIGLFSALNFVFNSFNASVTIIDCMENWCRTFKSVLQELKFGGYGNDWYKLAKDMNWKYIGANLLNDVTVEVSKPIASASFITMVKFVSASTCSNTEDMVDKIFRVMKPGALVLFIDNAAGGFTQIIERSGKRNGLVPVFDPLRHVDYESEALKIDRFGYTSCFKTRVTIILMQKLQNHPRNRGNQNPLPEITGPKSTFGVSQNLPNNRGKIVNTVSSRPSEVTKKSPAVGAPQKPASSLTSNQNISGINSKSSTVRPSTVSNGTVSKKGESTAINQLLEVTNKPAAVGTPQKPASSTIVGRNRSGDYSESKSRLVCPSGPENRVPNANQVRTTQLDSRKRNSSGVPVELRRPVAVVPPESPTKYRSPTGDRIVRPISGPSPTVRTYRPVAADQNQRGQRLREVDNSPEDTGCSCCTIS